MAASTTAVSSDWAELYAMRRSTEVWCFKCSKRVDVLQFSHSPLRFATVVELHCHGEVDRAELVLDPAARGPVERVEAVRAHLSRRLIAFLPEQGADMEHAFNRMGAPRA